MHEIRPWVRNRYVELVERAGKQGRERAEVLPVLRRSGTGRGCGTGSFAPDGASEVMGGKGQSFRYH